jgi:hypothetical protein
MSTGNVHLTKSEADSINKEIEQIVGDIREATNRLDNVMKTLIEGSEGDEIDALREDGNRLINALGSWMTSCIEVGVKIGNYVKSLINGDEEGARRIKDSMH